MGRDFAEVASPVQVGGIIQEDEDLKRRIDRRIVAIVYFLGLSALFTSLLGNAPFPGLKWIGSSLFCYQR